MREKSCRECGKVFQAKRRDAKTCSPLCRKAQSRRCEIAFNPAAELDKMVAQERSRYEKQVIEVLADRAQETAPECDPM